MDHRLSVPLSTQSLGYRTVSVNRRPGDIYELIFCPSTMQAAEEWYFLQRLRQRTKAFYAKWDLLVCYVVYYVQAVAYK